MIRVNEFASIQIGLSSPEQIREQSHGEVTKPETINYRTLKPERDGLFCERIFGPTKDWECACGKYKRITYKGITCDKCEVEVTRSRVRRERMAHIELAAPVAHIWFVKGSPSRIGQMLDISPKKLEAIVYFASFVITAMDEERRLEGLDNLDRDLKLELRAVREEELDRIEQLEEDLKVSLEEMQNELVLQTDRLKDQESRRRADREEESKRLLKVIAENRGEAALDDLRLSFREDPVVEHGEVIESKHRSRVTRALKSELARMVEREQVEIAELGQRFEEDMTKEQTRVQAEKDGADARIEQLLAEKEEFFNRRRDHLVELAKAGDDSELMLLSEDRYYQLNETVGEVFEAMSGAEAILELIRKKDIDVEAEQLREDLNSKSTQRRRKAVKRLRVIESIRRSENRPEWMVYTVLPVLPPELRPMVQLDGGRFATSDLNDLYRRVINRNNRLKRLLDLGAPDIILRNEKRMLQEAVDALIDNGRRGRPAQSSSQHMYKSLSDLLRGKQGRFRQNLLGKRVDYSGRSVIVVGPELALDECGLPAGMALELFKPFVMQQLVMRGIASNIKSAKRIVERVDPEVWDILEDVTREHPIMLNRAPTLHRLGIQAFRIRLVHGGAIRIHPLVCFAYNADFDGDQMAVHVPLSEIAQEEARELMLSSQNLLSPADGSPVISPTKDMILGCYYLTLEPEAVTDPQELRTFTGQDEALHAYESGLVRLHTPIRLRANADEVGTGENLPEGSLYETTIGRVIFDRILPVPMRPYGKVMDKGALKQLINDVYSDYGTAVCAQVGDQVMSTGFHWATRSGVTMALSDLTVPPDKPQILTETEELVGEISEQFEDGLLTEDERYRLHVKHWAEATQRVSAEVEECLDKRDSVYLMGASGAAKGNFDQIRQIAGMRGLMSDPGGRVIEMPVRANFREGLSVFEYFISTHGARKGLADTALRTADSGYLTRRLVDVCQDLIIAEHDCGTERSVSVHASDSQLFGKDLPERVYSRTLAAPLVDPETGEVLADAGRVIDLELMELIEKLKFDEIHVRSVMKCEAQNGICQACYGFDLARHEPVELGTAVGIIAAQSIGEPATQLTMRTFHTGGTFREEDITRGLPRVEELFEARTPRGQAEIADFGGVVSVDRSDDGVTLELVQQHDIELGDEYRALGKSGGVVKQGTRIAKRQSAEDYLLAPVSGQLELVEGKIILHESIKYAVPVTTRVLVDDGARVERGTQLTEGPLNPHDILRLAGTSESESLSKVEQYLLAEIQGVYSVVGVPVHDKHVELVIRQMLRRVKVLTPGDTVLLPDEYVDAREFNRVNSQSAEPATGERVLLGVTKASLYSDSFLSAASFQDTTRVLTESALEGARDSLVGLKENVIVGKLIPAGTGYFHRFAPAGSNDELTGAAKVVARINARREEREELKRQLEELQRLEEERWQASTQMEGADGFEDGFADYPYS